MILEGYNSRFCRVYPIGRCFYTGLINKKFGRKVSLAEEQVAGIGINFIIQGTPISSILWAVLTYSDAVQAGREYRK